MHKNKRSVTLLLLGILAAILLLFFTHAFPPSYVFSLSGLPVSSVLPFFLLFFFTLFGLAGFILKSSLQGIVAGLFGMLFLVLRMFSITHWFFTLLLVALFTTVEFFFINSK